jgi:hypothetical protein
MRWPWKRRAKLIDSGLPPNLRIIELQTAKEILAEIFGVRAVEMEERTHRRMVSERRLKTQICRKIIEHQACP